MGAMSPNSDNELSRYPRQGEQLLTVRQEQHGTSCIVEVAGEVDLTTVTQFEAAITRGLDILPGVLVVDLGRVTFLDSAGISVLIRAHLRAVDSVHIRFGVVAPDTTIYRTLQLTGVTGEIAVYQTCEEALAAR